MLNTYKAQFSGKVEIAPHIYKLTFEIDNELIFNSGQYVIFLIPHEGGIVRRLYSIASPQFHTKSFDIIVQFIEGGIASTKFGALNKGDILDIQGPAGIFGLKDTNRPKIFLATGTGIAPMISMIETHLTQMDAHAPKMKVFWGLRTRKDAYYVDELRGLAAQHSALNVRICLSRETPDSLQDEADFFIPGRIDAVLSQYILVHPNVAYALNSFDYYLCGSVVAVDTLSAILQAAGVEKTNIVSEKFV